MKRTSLALFLCLLAMLCVLPAVCPAKSDWTKVRTKNFVTMGDAGEKSLRRVGLELEQFREALKILFPRTDLEKPLPTVVYVFRSPDTFRQFKPRRNGKIQDQVGGYFFEGREHAVIALRSDISAEEIEQVKIGPEAPQWSHLERALLRAVDELHDHDRISAETWATLSGTYSTPQMLDVIFTVGQYHMVSFALNSVGVELDAGIADAL